MLSSREPRTCSQRERVLKPEEIKLIWNALGSQSPRIRDILRIQFLTAQRVGEVRQMRPQDVDLRTGWWTIPATFAKNKQSHRVPLSPTAITILDTLLKPSSRTWVFPALRDSSRPFGYQTIHKAVRQIRAETSVSDWSSHDLRRTVVSLLTGSGVSRETARKIVNHSDHGAIHVYDRHTYDAEKRIALDEWARRLQAIVDGTDASKKVVPFIGKTS